MGITNRNEGIFNRNAIFTIGITANNVLWRNLTLAISLNDIFKGLTYEESYYVNSINSKAFYYADAQEFSLSLKYHFGALKKSHFKNKTVDENLNRIN